MVQRHFSPTSCVWGEILNVKIASDPHQIEVLVPFSQGPAPPALGLAAILTPPGPRPVTRGSGRSHALSSRGNTRRVPRLETFWSPIPRSRSSTSSELLFVLRPPSRLVEAGWEPEEPFAVTLLSP